MCWDGLCVILSLVVGFDGDAVGLVLQLLLDGCGGGICYSRRSCWISLKRKGDVAQWQKSIFLS